jgi:L-ascorbate metabolism protein UlaG (beta-lactamase superfamily)
MPTIRRLSDSCLLVTTDDGTTLFDPGFHTFDSGEVDLEEIGDVRRVLITHEHGDHVKPEFVKWLVDRGTDLSVHSNDAVAELLAPHDIEVVTDNPAGASSEDVTHEVIPNGSAPPNRSWTLDGVLTHPGDSYEPTITAPVLALPLLVPWGSATASVEFARRLGPRQVVPVHDFYLSESGRAWIVGMVGNVLGGDDIELVPLDWGESYSF